MNQLISIYYDISEILNDETECVADAILHFTKPKKTRYVIMLSLEHLRLNQLKNELNTLYDTPMCEIQCFYKQWKIRQMDIGTQLTIMDFI